MKKYLGLSGKETKYLCENESSWFCLLVTVNTGIPVRGAVPTQNRSEFSFFSCQIYPVPALSESEFERQILVSCSSQPLNCFPGERRNFGWKIVFGLWRKETTATEGNTRHATIHKGSNRQLLEIATQNHYNMSNQTRANLEQLTQ